MNNILHIYGPTDWHSEAIIAGDREALKKLRDTIDKALTDKTGCAKHLSFVNDGEGFDMMVRLYSEEDAEKLSLPYTDEDAKDRRTKGVIEPWEKFTIEEGPNAPPGGWTDDVIAEQISKDVAHNAEIDRKLKE